MKKLTIETIKSEFSILLVSEQYVNSTTPLQWRCNCGTIFQRSYERMKHNTHKVCPQCTSMLHQTNVKTTQSHSHEYVYNFIKKQGCELISKYSGTYTDPLQIICKCGEKFSRSFQTFKNSKSYYCNHCSNKHTHTTESVAALVIQKGGVLIGKYSPRSKITVACPQCESNYKVRLPDFINKQNGAFCPTCSHFVGVKKNTNRISRERIVEELCGSGTTLITQDVTNVRQQLQLLCDCGDVYQQPYLTLRTRKDKVCPKCSLLKTYNIPKQSWNILQDKQMLHDFHHKQMLNMHQIAIKLSVSLQTVCTYFKRHDISIQSFQKSQYESEITQWLKDMGITKVITNDRNLIPPYEIDLYFPDKNIAIEFNGIYWHSEAKQKDARNIHYRKYLLCKEKGITLINIFEDEWTHTPDIVKKSILIKLGIGNVGRVYARNLSIRQIDSKITNDFLTNFHIQGASRSTVSYGGFVGEQLVACLVMIQTKPGIFLLNRYCTSDHVIGGFSKLLQHFKNNHPWIKIETFADLRWSVGNLYKIHGFIIEKVLPPDYYYIRNGNRYHKFNFRHQSLIKKFDNYDQNKSEYENCLQNGYYRLWDCGKIKYIIKNDI